MNDWNTFWVYGYRTALEAFLNTKKDENGYLPHEIFVSGPCFPQEENGLDQNGHTIYKKKNGAVKCLWCFSLRGNQEDLINELRLLNGPYTIIEDKTISEILIDYPEHCLGQGIPHIAGEK